MTAQVKQIKMLGGEEILCDLVDIQLDEYEQEIMIIRGAYTLVSQEDFESGFRYYTFRPFMMHVYDPEHLLALNSSAIICITNPHEKVIDQYVKHVEAFQSDYSEKESEDILEKLEEDRDERIIKFKPKLH